MAPGGLGAAGRMPAPTPRVPMPRTLSGGPSGPGASPITPAGAGAGNEAAADAVIKAIIPALHRAMSAYPIGGKKYTAVLNSLRALTANFGKEQQESMVPAALLQMMQASRSATPGPGQPPPAMRPAAAGAGAGPMGVGGTPGEGV
jgi:hypothetical protein